LEGGLGVISLRLQNEVLLMKNQHKISNKTDLPRVKLIWSKYYGEGQVPGHAKKSFLWKSILKLLAVYKGTAQSEARIEDTILF
jgi:hypothetical protein